MNETQSSLSGTLLVSTIMLTTTFFVTLMASTAFMSVRPTSAADTPLDVAVTLDPVISITTDATGGTLSIPITPTSGGAFASSDLTVSVLTNNSTGYTLLMNSSTANTSLEHMVDTTYTIPTTTHTNSAPGTLAANTWGYSRWADGQSATPTTFSRIPALASPDTLRTTTEVAGATDTRLTFGAVVSAAMASGSYANTVTFTATSNYVPEVLPFMQDFGVAECSALTPGETVQLRDSRDDKVYRVRRMADERCWMIDNLAYDINTAPATGKPTYNPTAQLVSGVTASVYNRAQYAQNTAAYNIENNGSPTPSYLYNWCAAMGDTSVNCTTTAGYTRGQPATPQTGICPAPFRLPMTGATPAPSTQGNGTNQATAAATTTNEFAKLDIWLGGTGTTRANANTYANFTTDDSANPQLFWSGALSGNYYSGLGNQGNGGSYWSSTAESSTYPYHMYVDSSTRQLHLMNVAIKSNAFAVRCIL